MSVAMFQPFRHIDLGPFCSEPRSETIVYTKYGASQQDCPRYRRKLCPPNLEHTCFDAKDHKCMLTPRGRDTSTGLDAVFFAFYNVSCDSLTLYGFATQEALDMPYHYWTDGSNHDNKTARFWYRSRVNSQYGHDFVREHKALYALSTDWTISRSSFHAKCRRNTADEFL